MTHRKTRRLLGDDSTEEPLEVDLLDSAEGLACSEGAAACFASLAAAGGQHEVLAGGVVFVHLPAGSAFDAAAELDRYLSSEWPDG